MFGHEEVRPENNMLGHISRERVMILLKHRPEVDPDSVGLFDLQLSGHTHGGQIFPFTVFTSLAYPYGVGLRYLERGSFLYVSSGAGTWGPPFRFPAPPGVTVIDMEGSGDHNKSIRYRRQHR
jgi:predicted MPP superfamily phosphohydrolase